MTLDADAEEPPPPAAPAADAPSYEGPGALNEPPPSIQRAVAPPPAAPQQGLTAEQAAAYAAGQLINSTPEQAAAYAAAPATVTAEQAAAYAAAAPATEQVYAQQAALTPEQAAYAATPDVQAAYAAAAAAYAQQPQHYPQQEVNRRLGQWTREEEAYAEKVAELFKTGRVPNCPEGTTMRALLADLLNCAPMRVSKKFSGERAIGKCSYKRITCDLDQEETDLQPLELAFHDSVRGMGHLKMSLCHTTGLITPVRAKENKRAARLQSQQTQDQAWSQAAAQRDAQQQYIVQQQQLRGQPPPHYFAGAVGTSAAQMYQQYAYAQYPQYAYADGQYDPSAAVTPSSEPVTEEQQQAQAQALAQYNQQMAQYYTPEQQQVMMAQYTQQGYYTPEMLAQYAQQGEAAAGVTPEADAVPVAPALGNAPAEPSAEAAVLASVEPAAEAPLA